MSIDPRDSNEYIRELAHNALVELIAQQRAEVEAAEKKAKTLRSQFNFARRTNLWTLLQGMTWAPAFDTEQDCERPPMPKKASHLRFSETWGCPGNVYNTCVYDITRDSARDDCLFCRQPDERQ